ncbi:Cof-type HAD-IIB family hydrolase [uncultured Clostridium sp.]|uniref:Cof-type HAD-IIB family hydrolase n=1 Tax=uncultured Clostridium sp. TaxID=59620 RepID=UPI0028EB3494|nr:Cof-type HAD-IIB family hydrolase [uncultured Clostridium sp.]
MIKLIVSDMDGTLLNSEHKISKENLEAIKKAEERGVHFAIATGRAYQDVKPFIDECDLECQCILMNGAEYRDENGKILENIYIDKEKTRRILEVLKNGGFSVELYTDKGIYTTNTKEEAYQGMIYRVKSFDPHLSEEEILENAKVHPHLLNLKYIEDINKFLESEINIAKVIVFYDDVDVIKKLKFDIEKIEGLIVASTFVTNVEINNIEAQKGLILSKVIKKMGINKDEVIVLGDSFNDYSLFTEFPNSFAMENAIPEIKEIAKHITDTNDNSGVAKAIYKAINEEI